MVDQSLAGGKADLYKACQKAGVGLSVRSTLNHNRSNVMSMLNEFSKSVLLIVTTLFPIINPPRLR
jgi:hypothetical protein